MPDGGSLARLHAALQAAAGGTAGLYTSWEAMFDQSGIAPGHHFTRQLNWLNDRLGANHVDLYTARDEFARQYGAEGWFALDLVPGLDPADLILDLDFEAGRYRLSDGTALRSYDAAALPGLAVTRAELDAIWRLDGNGEPVLERVAADTLRDRGVDPISGKPTGLAIAPISQRLTTHFNAPSNWADILGTTPGRAAYGQSRIDGLFADGVTVTTTTASDGLVMPDVGLTAGVPIGIQILQVAGSAVNTEIDVRRADNGFLSRLTGPIDGPDTIYDLSNGASRSGWITDVRHRLVDGDIHWIGFTFTPDTTVAHRVDIGAGEAGVSFTILGAGCETNARPTAPILDNPAGASARSVEQVDLTGLAGLVPAGQALTFVVDFDSEDQASAQTVASLEDGGDADPDDEQHRLSVDATGQLLAVARSGDATTGDLAGSVDAGRNRVVYMAGLDDFRLVGNAHGEVADAAGALPAAALDHLKIGHSGDGLSPLAGHVRRVRAYATARSASFGRTMALGWPDEQGTHIADATPISFDLTMVSLPEPSAHNQGSPSFNNRNDGYARHDEKVVEIKDGATKTIDFGGAMEAAVLAIRPDWDRSWDTGFSMDNYIHWDANDRAYTLVTPRYSNIGKALLLWSDDLCRTWSAVELGGGVSGVIEKFDTNNDSDGLPTILTYENYGNNEGDTLWLERLTESLDGSITVEAPVVVATDSILAQPHSGGGNSTLTTADKIFVAYPVRNADANGTLCRIRQFNRSTGAFDDGSAIDLGRSNMQIGANPAYNSDRHDVPVITRTSDGKLHIVIGAHHARFRGVSSVNADDVLGGLTAPVDLGWVDAGSQGFGATYASWICDANDIGHIVCRSSHNGYRKALTQISVDPSTWTEVLFDGQPYRDLIMPVAAWYVRYYHRLTLDRLGAMVLFEEFGPDNLTEAEALLLGLDIADADDTNAPIYWFGGNRREMQRTNLVSKDGGQTWFSSNKWNRSGVFAPAFSSRFA